MSTVDHAIGESSSLLLTKSNKFCCTKASCCVKSKAACWILLWNFAVLLAYEGFYNIDAIMQASYSSAIPIAITVSLTVITIFSPLAGLLTDIKFSRYRAVKYSSYAIVVKLTAFLLITITALIVYHLVTYDLRVWQQMGIAVYCGMVIFVPVYIIFIINAIQFGMDQLHSSSTEDSVLFIHWYVWIYYTSFLITAVSVNFVFYDRYMAHIRVFYTGTTFVVLINIATLSMLVASLCVLYYRKVRAI